MAVNWKRVLTWVIAIAFIVGLVFFLFDAFGEKPSAQQLMLQTITLYSTNDTVQRAGLITEMDRTVHALGNGGIIAQWNILADCIAGSACTQDDYFDFLLMIANELPGEVPHSDLVVNTITANRYWGDSSRIIEFSKSLSEANNQVEALQLKTVRNKWQEIIYCDGRCREFHPLFFEFIRLLLSV
jgi:hypothetical protein